jgi:hypothetical protein
MMGRHEGQQLKYFLEKMVEHFSLDPYGSCFPKEVWDPTALPPEDTWAQLSKALKRADQRRAAERAARAAVAFGSGGVHMPATAAAGPGAAAAAAAGGVHQLQQAPKGPGLSRAPIEPAAAAGGIDAATGGAGGRAGARHGSELAAAGWQQVRCADSYPGEAAKQRAFLHVASSFMAANKSACSRSTVGQQRPQRASHVGACCILL